MKSSRIFIIIGVLLLASPALHAQNFLQKAKNYLDAGECEKAQRAYNAYKVENPGGNAEVERRIEECWKTKDSLQALLDGQPCPGTPTVKDIDGNTYKTVQLGKQCWMKENLRAQRYADGTKINYGHWDTSTTKGYYYSPYNDIRYVKQNGPQRYNYGYLYNWKAVMGKPISSNADPSGVQGICPNGWHVPSDAEWLQLTDYVSSQSRYVCGNKKNSIGKALSSDSQWQCDNSVCFEDGHSGGIGSGKSKEACDVCNNQDDNNTTGFTALPAGSKSQFAYDFGGITHFWSATEVNGGKAIDYYILGDSGELIRNKYGHEKLNGYSVRCIRD